MKNVKYISASAGSGKTYSLTQILTQTIKDGKVEPENVILTTFTKAAAAEFKDKAKAMFYANGMVNEADRLDQALIGTIHSVAESFIQKYWYVLGLSPKINPIAENDLDFYKNQSLVNLLEEEEIRFLNLFAEEFNIKIIMTNKIDYDFWKDDLSKILEYTKNYQITDYKPSIDYSKKIATDFLIKSEHIKINFDLLTEIINKAEELNNVDESTKQHENKKYISRLKILAKNKKTNSICYVNKIIDLLKKITNKHLKDLINEFNDSLSNLYCTEEVHELINKYIDILFSLAKRWNKIYQEYKTENHLIDFSDMENYFYQLLDNKEVASDIKATYKYVFVDEFQDCSPIQVKIFDKLSEIVEQSIWVGDKKQAIYGFRGSDTVLTSAVMDIIKENEKKNLDGCSTRILDKSWRSLPEIVNFTNKVFEKGFSKENPDEIKLTPVRKDDKGCVGYWWIPGKNKDIRNSALAANIVELVNKGENPSDIAILARSNADLKDIATCLRLKNVPVYIDESGHSGSDTVNLVTSLLQLVTDEKAELPKAQIAFLTEENFTLKKILDDKIDFNIQENKNSLFYENIPLVKSLLKEKDRYKLQSVSALVESLIIELDLYNVAKKLNDNVDTTKLLHTIINSAKEYEDNCVLMHLPSSISGFISYIENNDISVSGTTEGVQLFTYHRSKGLEWKTVILLSCDEDILDNKKFIKRNIFGTQIIREGKSTKENLYPEVKISLFPNLFGNSSINQAWESIITESERYNDLVENLKEETKRLMYVAMTRPRDKLIIVLNGSRNKIQEPMKALSQLDFDVSSDYLNDKCDLLGVGYQAKKFENADLEIEYEQDEIIETTVNLKRDEDKNSLIRDLQPSNMPSGYVFATLYDCKSSINILDNEKYNYSNLGTCIHDIFCTIENKTEQEISNMIKNYRFEKIVTNPTDIKNSWEGLIEFLKEKYGEAIKQYHELPFKHKLQTGQIVTGSMDFVWETSKGCVLVDYKTFPGDKEELIDENSEYFVGKYKGQMDCYENALTAGGKKVLAKLLFYPVVGVISEI